MKQNKRTQKGPEKETLALKPKFLRRGRLIQPSFFRRDTHEVARQLLGKRIIRRIGNRTLSGIIVETEAYLGVRDAACHSYGGRRTARNQTMYQDAGAIYIYMIYGLYHCLNFVTAPRGDPQAVLIRAIEPELGVQWMHKFRKTQSLRQLTSGPGKVCQALHLDRKFDGKSIIGGSLFLEDIGVKIKPYQIKATKRIGVDYAGTAANRKLRFYIKENPFISKR